MTYKVENCPKCGGTHFGSYVCPFNDTDAKLYRETREQTLECCRKCGHPHGPTDHCSGELIYRMAP